MVFITEKQFIEYMLIAFDGLLPEHKEYWDYCISKYRKYAEDAISAIVDHFEEYKNDETKYLRLEEQDKWVKEHWNETISQYTQHDYSYTQLRPYPPSIVFDDSINLYDDLSSVQWVDYDQETSQKRTIRKSLYTLLAYSFYSKQLGKRKLNNPTKVYSQIVKYRQTPSILKKETISGLSFNPNEKWQSKHCDQSKMGTEPTNHPDTTNDTKQECLPIPMAISRLIEADLIQETGEGSRIFINQKESLNALKLAMQRKGITPPTNNEIHKYIWHTEDDIAINQYTIGHVRNTFKKRTRKHRNS